MSLAKMVNRTLDRLDIQRLSEALAQLAFENRHEEAPAMRPPRMPYLLAFTRELAPDEWVWACRRYQSELVRLIVEAQDAAEEEGAAEC
jgi:hypothetical protein